MSPLRRRLSGTLLTRVVALTLGAGLLAGCSDGGGDPDGGGSPETSSSATSASPTEQTSPTETEASVEPATGPRLSLENAGLRLPEGWKVDDAQASFQVTGTAANRTGQIFLASIPALNPDVNLEQLTRIAAKTRRLPKSSIQSPTTLAGMPAYHLSGRAAGDDVEQFGALVDGDILTVEFVWFSGKDTGREELIESVLETVEIG